ncbi:MAG: hypothetical protein M3040_06240 [Bacteroidota bacterium]|nr:hypothetical protein [Bacteroidota bacterium]
MSGFPIVDLVIGMIFIYFLLSIISSSAVEMVLTGWRVRAKVLAKWLCTIFDTEIAKPDKTTIKLGQAIMDHCSITALSKAGKAPSYIDAKNFTSALIEKVTYDTNNPKSIATNLDEVIKALEDTTMLSIELQRAFLGYAYEARDTYANISTKTISEVEYFRNKIEHWFDSSMDRITGTLKTKYVRPITLGVAILTAGLLNADSVAIAKFLYSNPEVRVKLAEQGYKAGSDTAFMKRLTQVQLANRDTATSASLEQIKHDIRTSVENISDAKAALETSIPLGWNKNELQEGGKWSPSLILTKISGLLATILAIFMGAPFWFDLLNKIANLRGTGPKPSSSTNNTDEDKG